MLYKGNDNNKIIRRKAGRVAVRLCATSSKQPKLSAARESTFFFVFLPKMAAFRESSLPLMKSECSTAPGEDGAANAVPRVDATCV